MFGVGFLIKLLVPKLGERAGKAVAYMIAIAVVALTVWLIYWFISSRIENYGDRREQAGVDKERAAWVEAGERLKAEASASATKADDRAAARLEQHKEQIDEDRKAVNQAVNDGTSPLDALFGR